MLTKRSRGAWPLRWGVVAVAAIVPFVLPAAASASSPPPPTFNVSETANAESIQYVNAGLGAGVAAPVTYANAETQNSAGNGRDPFGFSYSLQLSFDPEITATNTANADVSNCGNCGAVAIAFQTVLVAKNTLADLDAIDTANAVSTGCRSTCNSLAEGFQIVYATNDVDSVDGYVEWAVNDVANELRDLGYSGYSNAQIESQSVTLVDQLICVLQDKSVGVTPATNCASNEAAWVSATQPAISLLSEINS
jgi:hypothetical protein